MIESAPAPDATILPAIHERTANAAGLIAFNPLS
jgi:hypothetical protein